MSWEEVCHFIAQGAINIEYGHTTIEVNSPVHKAMLAFCEYANKGRVRLASSSTKRKAKGKNV
jgi:hypothetical protein